VFFDKASGLLVRRDRSDAVARATWTYDDFVTAAGWTHAKHVAVTFSDSKDPAEWRLKTARDGSTLAANAFVIPANRRILDEFPAGVTKVRLPADFLWTNIDERRPSGFNGGMPVIPVQIGDRTVDFVLASGQNQIVLDRDTANELGLKLSGSQTIVPQMTIGQITLKNVAVGTSKIDWQSTAGHKVLGFLGYDFIADAVIHLNYADQQLEAIDPGAFHPETIPGAIEVPLDLDHRVAKATVQVGKSIGGRFVVTTESPHADVFSGFAARHPNDVRDKGAGALTISVRPFQYAGLYNQGETRVVPIQVDQIVFAGTAFTNPLAYRVPASSQSVNVDGKIGVAILSFYDLYFDYGNGRLIAVPNKFLMHDAVAPAKH
jgi:hypothetical protein